MIAALFPELLGFGGIQLAGRQIAASLAAIAADRSWPFCALSLNDPKGEHESCVGDLRFHFEAFERRKAQFILAALKTARARPRIIFAGHPNLAPVASAMKLFAGNPQVIVSTHGIEVWHPLPFIRRRALRRADVVLTPSTDTARRIAAVQHIAHERIRKLAWPLDPDFLALAAAPARLSPPEQFPRGDVVLSVGRWAASERYKGADLLIHAIANLANQFPELHLVLVGTGDDVPRLQELAQRSGSSERMHFLTNLSRQALAACYASASIFALPSSGEGFGLVFLEAMAMKKPVIGAALGGIPDIVQDGETGFLVVPEDPSSLLAALRSLLSAPDLRRRMGERGGEVVHTHFSFNRFQDKLKAILSSAIPGSISV
ncbi:MAG TPA: glycosyltransferase family 4 protein [Candidatus Acidoferrales bacterium]|nr:glycosyltransferase family 4 protein [Candidatus Acidoferrales bacterium]